MHPRTRKRWTEHLAQCNRKLRVIDPLGYVEFLALQKHATLVITDSGGIQEESTFLGVPCFTLRENTERPITVTMGTNVLIGHNWDLLREHFYRALHGNRQQNAAPPLWDGKTATRIADILSRQGI